MRCATFLALALLAAPAFAQDDLSVLRPDKDDVPPRKMLYEYLRAQAAKHFEARRKAIAAIKTPDDLRRRQHELREKFVAALGGFPEKTPLNARVVGKEQGDGYRLERVIYESRPRHHVTATLYLPEGEPPFPGVLMPIGHSATGKAAEYVQRGCILLAKNGLAVLAYDPIGQGERRQLPDVGGNPAVRGSTTEHTLAGVGALLVGRNTASYRVWDGIRSLDYLASRPEIDPRRLGCTGCSGGGTLTSYLMALDERIVAAAPSCYITSLERLFATIGPQDAEQNITGQVAFGMDHADYLTMRAPRPTLVCAATRDFFDIGGTWDSFREAKALYGLMGYGERVGIVEYNTPHGYPKPQREAVVRFMRQWLLGKTDAPTEGDFPIRTEQELFCTRTGHVLEDLKGKSVFDLNAERAAELARERAKSEKPRAALLARVRERIGLPEEEPKEYATEFRGTIRRDGYTVHKLLLTTEPGIVVPVLRFAPKERAAKLPLVIYVDGRGKAAGAGPGGAIERLVRQGHTVVAPDLRGFGETSPSEPAAKPSHFGTTFKESFLALHLNRPLLGQRVLDLLQVVNRFAPEAGVSRKGENVRTERYADDPEVGSEGLHIVGVGTAGPVVLHAAALDERIQAVTLENSLVSWEAVVRSPITFDQLTNAVPGALADYDLPELAATIAPRPLAIRNAADPKQRPAALAEVEEAYAVCRAAYQAASAAEKFSLGGEEAGAIDPQLAPYFRPPAEFADDFGDYRSPLKFDDGTPVRTAADWKKRRKEILDYWHSVMGEWPPLLEKPKIEYLSQQKRDNFTQHHVRVEVAPGRATDDAYLLVPEGEGPFPAVLVVYYESKTGIGEAKQPLRDFAYQLAKRGFVTLSLGGPPSSFYPDRERNRLQPLSYHAYEAANCHTILAQHPKVDPQRIGVVGHSYGGKWAMFAACLYDKFAAVAVSDPGIVFDEKRPNVNYWDEWYLGFEPGKVHKRGRVPNEQNPRTGAYKKLVEEGRDLHELHALLAPRPFLVSGGSEDPPERWKALNHLAAVNRLLGYENRAGMTNRNGHAPTEESNAVLYRFFEWALKK